MSNPDRSRDIVPVLDGPVQPIECSCGLHECRCGSNSVAEDMGWQKINGLWLCPVCGGRWEMFLAFWDDNKWGEPNQGQLEL
jgi:hypothetical protein